MKQNSRLDFGKGDWLAVGLVLMLAAVTAVGFYPKKVSSGRLNVQIYQAGELLYELPLEEDITVTVDEEYDNVITIQNGKVGITESNCPGSDCVHSGWISEGGRSIVCLPNRTEIRITGASDVDFVVR